MNGTLKCDEKLLDEYLELYKSSNKYKNVNTVTDLEIMAIKNIFDNPTTISGFNQMKNNLRQVYQNQVKLIQNSLPESESIFEL